MTLQLRPFNPRVLHSAVVLLLLLSLSSWSQEPRINLQSTLASLELKQWTQIQQIPIERVYDLAQDSIGYLWIGSDRGLLRFDGSQLVKYNLLNTPLETENVNQVEVDGQGVVWLANRRGVFRLENGVMTQLLDTDGNQVPWTTSLLLDKEGRLWLTTRFQQVYFYEDGVLKAYDPNKAHAYLIFKDQQDRLYLRNSEELGVIYRFSPQKGMHALDIPDLPPQRIQAVNSDRNGNLYWVTEKGEAWKWDGSMARQLNEATQRNLRVHKLLVGPEGDLWFGENKLVRVRPDGRTEMYGMEEGLTDNRIIGLLADRDGDVWIGTRYGLNRLSNTPFNLLVEGEWPDITEYCIAQAPDMGPILIGTENSGLYILTDGKLSPLRHPALNNKIETLAFDQEGHVLVGQPDGLLKFRLESGSLAAYQRLDEGNVTILHVSPQNEYLYAVANKDFKVYREGHISDIPSNDRFFIWMVNTPDDRVWVGTRSGLLMWDGKGLQPPPSKDPFFELYMISSTPAFGGGNWIGSYGTGIVRIEDSTVSHFTTRNGMPVNQSPYLYQFEESSLWLYVNDQQFGHVVRLIPTFSDAGPYMSQGESYSLNQALTESQDEFIGYPEYLSQPEKGRILLQGEQGPFTFEPGSIRIPPPKARLEYVQVSDSLYPSQQTIELAAGTRNIEFHYAAIDFFRGPNQQFEYRLKGYDEAWQKAGPRTVAYYSNLPAGEFQFQLRILQADGGFSLSEEVIEVVQEEYWYKRSWAYILYAVGLAGLINLIFQLRLRQVKLQRNKLKEQVALRTRELNELNHTLEDLVEERTQELTDSEERYRYALDAADDGIFDWDVPTDTMKLSPAVYTLLGFEPYSFEESRQLVLERVHQDDQAGMDQLEVLLTEVKDTRFVKHEFRMAQKDGTLIWVRLKAKIFERDPQGNPVRVVGTINDITSEKNKTRDMLDAVLKTEDLERSRISKDIHDGLQQTLTLAKMNFRGVQPSVDLLPEKAADKFNAGLEFLETSIAESRSVAHNLMPKAILEFGVVSAFESLIEKMDKAAENTQYNFYHNFKSSKLDNQQIEVTLYRVLQESLNNIVKYARASRVEIQLMEYEKLYVLTIEDDGIGFDMTEPHNSEGLGFTSMRNRLDAINGFLEVNSHPGKGVSILVEVNKHFG